MLEREAEHAPELDAPSRSALLERLGDVAWRRLRSTTRATRSYAAALEAAPENFSAHRSLETLLEGVEDWRGALDLYESEAEVLGERDPEHALERPPAPDLGHELTLQQEGFDRVGDDSGSRGVTGESLSLATARDRRDVAFLRSTEGRGR